MIGFREVVGVLILSQQGMEAAAKWDGPSDLERGGFLFSGLGVI
jgi:hypothetical protein